MQNLPQIRVLVVNDDGIESENLKALTIALESLDEVSEVVVVAPETEQSGVSQAFTVRKGLSLRKVAKNRYALGGTPADCGKFALGHLAKFGDNQGECTGDFDLCFSGVNVGENSGVSSLYSGTVAGAREATLWGVPGIALSLRGGNDLLDVALEFACQVVKKQLYKNIPAGVFWNVNFPKGPLENFKGFAESFMALEMFTDHYSFENGMWNLDGNKQWELSPKNSDDFLLNKGFATITPHSIDQTNVENLKLISKMIAHGDFC